MCRAFEEVREETKHEQSIEIAKSLLEVGKMTYEEIARSVQLPVEEVKALDCIQSKWESFGFNVISCDGNNIEMLISAFEEAKLTKGKPSIIIAHTVKGKGVSFMENKAGWHGKAPNDEEYAIAMDELEKAGEALCQK